MPFFDFHCHPSLKQMLAPPTETLSPWHQLNVKLKVGKLFGRETQIGIDALFNGIFNSQSNLTQMQKAGVNLAGVIIYAVENKIAEGILERKIAGSGKINLMYPPKLQELALGKNYYAWTKKTIDALINNPTPPAGTGAKAGSNFKFINKIQEYNQADEKTIHGLLILEGLHNLCNDPFSANAEADFNNNLDDLTTRYKTRLFAVNIPHMQSFPCANHAFGMQFIKEELFYPTSAGFNDWGKRAIKKLYDKGTLIDFKHMSLFTRKQLIAEKSKQGYSDFPLICTHAGLTGIHSDKRYSYLNTRPKPAGADWRLRHHKILGKVSNSAFNLSSINLYDEEIIDIVRSKGLIGISMDQRIVGFPVDSVVYQLNDYPYDQEYISKPEQEYFFRGYTDPSQVPHLIPGDDILNGDEAQTHGEMSHEYHHFYFLNQVFHILSVCKKAGISAKEAGSRICLGSDFDGLINALDCCTGVTELAEFKAYLRQILSLRSTFWKTIPINKSEVDIDELLDGVFFTNAYNFLKKNFS